MQHLQGLVWEGSVQCLVQCVSCSPILSSFYCFRLAEQRTASVPNAGRHAGSTLMDPRTLPPLPATVTLLAVSN